MNLVRAQYHRVQLANEGIVEEVLGIVDESGIDRSAVVLELTESALIADFSLIVDRINTLRTAGLRVAIDDFGTAWGERSNSGLGGTRVWVAIRKHRLEPVPGR